MSNEILDYEVDLQKDGKFGSVINWLGIILLWLGVASTAYIGYFNLTKLIVGAILLLVATVSMYRNFSMGVKITFFVTLIGAVDFVDFFPIKYFVGFRFLGIGLGFELILVIVSVIHFVVNRTTLMQLIRDLFQSNITPEEVESAKRSKINGFKKRFSNRTIRELEVIAVNNKLVSEANQAAKELLEENTNP